MHKYCSLYIKLAPHKRQQEETVCKHVWVLNSCSQSQSEIPTHHRLHQCATTLQYITTQWSICATHTVLRCCNTDSTKKAVDRSHRLGTVLGAVRARDQPSHLCCQHHSSGTVRVCGAHEADVNALKSLLPNSSSITQKATCTAVKLLSNQSTQHLH